MNYSRGSIRLSILVLAGFATVMLAGCGGVVPTLPPTPQEPQVLVVTATTDPNAAPTAVIQPTAVPPTAAPAEGAEPTAAATEEPAATEEAATEEPAAVGDIAPVTNNADWEPQTMQLEGITWVLVPPGCFMMGDKDGFTEETPENEQCFDGPFWIAQTETTNEQYGSQGSFFGDDLPRDDVTWEQAENFCQSVGGRLPTEREWEYAARGPSAWMFPMGDTLQPGFVIHAGNARSAVAVGSQPDGQSWVGAYDMAGNLREWTRTAWEDYPYDPTDGREDDPSGEVRRVVRGASFQYGTDRLRSSFREFYDRNSSTVDVGFRCAMEFTP